jgi:hypothetical protein
MRNNSSVARIIVALSAILATHSVSFALTVTGSTGVLNTTNATQTFGVTFFLPVGSSITNPVISGSITGTVTDGNGDNATVSALAGQSIYTAIIDNVDEHFLMTSPFSQNAGGALFTSPVGPQSFGIPTPIAASQAVDTNIGVRMLFNLTAHDSASFTAHFTVEQGPPPSVVPTPAAAWAGLALIGGIGLRRAATTTARAEN